MLNEKLSLQMQDILCFDLKMWQYKIDVLNEEPNLDPFQQVHYKISITQVWRVLEND